MVRGFSPGVIPAKAETHEHRAGQHVVRPRSWVPAFAGMTLLVGLAACDVVPPPANNQAEGAPRAAAPQGEGELTTAERRVRERLGHGPDVVFSNPRRSASEGVTIVCGEYARGEARQRYIVVDSTDVFLEPELQPGEMDRYYGEFCGEGPGNRPPPAAPQGNAQ